jgi:hypothetical protein
LLVFLKHRLVVFSTPKCGSTALEKSLAPLSDIVLQGDPRIKHCTFHRYKWRFEKFLAIFESEPPDTTALIRHPQDWLGSWYRYRHGSWLDGTAQSTKGVSFDQFVDGYLADEQPAFATVGSQARFLTHPKTGETVDHLFRYDAFEDFRSFLENRLGQSIALDRLNASPEMRLSLAPQLARRLESTCAADFALYERAYAPKPQSRMRSLMRALAS